MLLTAINRPRRREDDDSRVRVTVVDPRDPAAPQLGKVPLPPRPQRRPRALYPHPGLYPRSGLYPRGTPAPHDEPAPNTFRPTFSATF